jgi:hypothetical protein
VRIGCFFFTGLPFRSQARKARKIIIIMIIRITVGVAGFGYGEAARTYSRINNL